jgi:carbon-monoxide dehydrogenase small subunit/2-furoyl-CoA dehydrogenase 2Fe-2S iron sulfur subunit
MRRIQADTLTPVALRVNGRTYRAAIEPRMLLSDFLREECGLTGTHVGCEHGVCGSCTILLDGEAVRSCLLLAVAVEGQEITTIEGLTQHPTFSAVYRAFTEHHALQCGFCTPGLVASAIAEVVGSNKEEEDIVDVLSGHLCRCTGYIGLKKALYELARTTEVSSHHSLAENEQH